MTKSINKIVIKRIMDNDPDLSFLEQDYTSKDISAKENKKYQAQDKKRLEAYYNGEWHMIGIRAEAIIHMDTGRYKNGNGQSAGWQIHEISSGGLWGIESDSGEEYFQEVAQDQIEDLTATLEEFGFSKEDVTKAPIETVEVDE